MSALAIQSGIDRKLHGLTRPAHSGVSAPTERSRDAEAEAGGQRPADAEARDLRSGGIRSGGLKSGSLRSGGLKSGGLRSKGLKSGSQRSQVRSPNQEILD